MVSLAILHATRQQLDANINKRPESLTFPRQTLCPLATSLRLVCRTMERKMPGPSFCDPASAIDQGTEEPRSRSLLVVGIQHHKHPLGLRLSAVTFQRQFCSSKRAISRCTGKNNQPIT